MNQIKVGGFVRIYEPYEMAQRYMKTKWKSRPVYAKVLKFCEKTVKVRIIARKPQKPTYHYRNKLVWAKPEDAMFERLKI